MARRPPGRARRGGAAVGLVVAALLAPLAQAAPLPPLPPRDFQGAYDPVGNAVTLTWRPPDDRHAYHYVLYRGTTLLGTVEGLNHTDTEPSPSASTYLIQAVRPGGPGSLRTQQGTAAGDQHGVHAT
ncbi:MAG TPA: hypothetical protein VHI93_05460, partial [Candidatus Thermoplasmatota archaeon]|nr:hypothetical protein [Candidatus Thermoplasmatota archaeon]